MRPGRVRGRRPGRLGLRRRTRGTVDTAACGRRKVRGVSGEALTTRTSSVYRMFPGARRGGIYGRDGTPRRGPGEGSLGGRGVSTRDGPGAGAGAGVGAGIWTGQKGREPWVSGDGVQRCRQIPRV